MVSIGGAELSYCPDPHIDKKSVQKAGYPDFQVEIEMSCFYKIPYINADTYCSAEKADHRIAYIDPALFRI